MKIQNHSHVNQQQNICKWNRAAINRTTNQAKQHTKTDNTHMFLVHRLFVKKRKDPKPTFIASKLTRSFSAANVTTSATRSSVMVTIILPRASASYKFT